MIRKEFFKNLFILNLNIFLFYPLFYSGISFFKGEYLILNFLLIILILLFFILLSFFVFFFISKNKFLVDQINKLFKFLIIFFLISCFFLPLSIQDGLVSPVASRINKINLILSLTISLILFLLVKHKFKLFYDFNYILSFLILIFFSYSYIYINKSQNVKISEKILTNEKFNSGISFGNKNFLVLSFDGINSHLIYKLIKKEKSFKDFEFFHNVFSQAPATFFSMSGELFGNLDYKSIGKNDYDLKNNLPYEKLIINKNKKYDIVTYAGYNDFNLNDDTKLPYLFNSLKNSSNQIFNLTNINTFNIYTFSLARISTRYSAKIFDRTLKFIIKLSIKKNKFDNFNLNTKLFFHKGKSFDVNLIPTIMDFKYLINNISYKYSDKLKLKYFHFDFTHFPVDFDENCKYMSYDQAWHDSNQNENGLLNETRCLVNLLEDFISNLKKQNLYDNTFILLKSDHGQPTYYYNSRPYNIKFNSHPSFGYSRYNSTLMIKPIGAVNTNLKDNFKTLSLNSINSIICLYIKEFCELKNYSKSDKLQIYIPQNENSTYYIDNLKKIIFRKKEELYQLENE